ncbi:TMEM175 family protein [Fusobacterium varium]|uniref:TMEM175 family protein n=1 Tax=Fusobacterium varium TaxID=856 RepID=UPI0035677283
MFEKNRIEAFSDGVIAIIITIMVLELKAPHKADISELSNLFPKFFSYILSFLYVGIYWNNHHHTFSAVNKINGKILWALFWLSLIPFTTSWMGETNFSGISAMIYGGILLACSIAYFILIHLLIKSQGKNSKLRKAIGNDIKGKISPFLYLIGIISAFFLPAISLFFYAFTAVLWIIPDNRIEKIHLEEEK